LTRCCQSMPAMPKFAPIKSSWYVVSETRIASDGHV
jgi:hypothetical protein